VARLSLLSKVGALAGTLDYEEVLSALARLSIPELADWCIVDVIEQGQPRRMEVAHRDPARAPLAAALRAFKLDHHARRRLPPSRVIESGEPVLIPDYTDDLLAAQTDGEYLALARQLQVRSVLVVPVKASAFRASVAFLMTSESGRRYEDEDLAVAVELVQRSAQIVENALVHQRLRQTEQRFRVALAHSRITLFEQDPDGRYRWVYNPPLGLEPADVLGKSNHELLAPADAARLDALDRSVMESGARVHEEVRLSRPGREPHHLLVSQEPLRDGSGAIVGLTGAATDITEQKRVQAELAQALAFRDQMVGVLGHDLRNPLSAARALITLVLRRDDLPEGARRSLAEVDRAGERMLELIETLLDFSGSRFTGSVPVVPVPTDLHDVCRGAVRELLAAEPRRAIEVELRGDGRGTWDPARMAQVVSNLVANALEHGVQDRPVQVAVGGDGDDAVLLVHNDGPAIPPALMEVMFEPFCRGSTLRDASHARGLGLGLHIVRQVVSAHGGTIAVDSTAERGTTFTVRLPRAGAGARAARWDEGAASLAPGRA
jgi:PAS domain S-box-containing protein